MTQLTIANAGDNKTLSPISPSIIRKSKDGDINISHLLLGTHFNINMDGILSTSTKGDISSNSLSVSSSKLDLASKTNGTTIAEYIASFNTTMYFYPGIKIKGHLELDESSSTVDPLPKYFVDYRCVDLVSGNELVFSLHRTANNVKFQLLQIIGDTTITTSLSTLVTNAKEIEFEFRYLENGKSAIYIVTYESSGKQNFLRVWKGDLKVNMNECVIKAQLQNEATTVKHLKSDYLFIRYPVVYLTYDVDNEDIYKGQIIIYDDNNSSNPDNWVRIISRDYKFKGNRVIENGITRMIIKTNNPMIELWGWNYKLTTPMWEKFCDIIPLNNDKVKSSYIQNLVIENFTINQVKLKINFGNTIYEVTMTRGCPYINITDRYSKFFNIVTSKNRFTGDFTSDNNYDIDSAKTKGHPSIRSETSETISSPTMNDNWWSWYTNNGVNEMLGWLVNLLYPNKVVVTDRNDKLDILLEYSQSANIYGVGCLIGDPNSVINNKPQPFINNIADEYVKYRANEGLWSFKQSNFIRRRNVG